MLPRAVAVYPVLGEGLASQVDPCRLVHVSPCLAARIAGETVFLGVTCGVSEDTGAGIGGLFGGSSPCLPPAGGLSGMNTRGRRSICLTVPPPWHPGHRTQADFRHLQTWSVGLPGLHNHVSASCNESALLTSVCVSVSPCQHCVSGEHWPTQARHLAVHHRRGPRGYHSPR